jgi:tetratricopeptide (TPR) repeat protein
MRKINGKLFLGLLVGTAVLAGAVFAIHVVQYQRIAQALLWQARRAEEQGQVERMARYLSRYLEFSPRDDLEKAHLAVVWSGEAFANAPRLRYRAVRLLDDVLAHDASRTDLRRLLVKSALELGTHPDILKLARGHLEKLLPYDQVVRDARRQGEVTVDRERGELEGCWGQLLEAEGRPADAIRCCRLAVRHNPETSTVYVRLAWLLRRSGEGDAAARAANGKEADDLMDRLVTRNDTSHKSYLARWRYRREFDLIELRPDGSQPASDKAKLVRLTEAANDVAQALKRSPEMIEVLLAAADKERLLGQAAYEDGRLSPEARQRQLQEHRDEAYRLLERGVKLQAAQPSRVASEEARFQLLWQKAGLLLDDLKRADVRRPDDPGAVPARRLRAWDDEVVQTIDELRKTRISPAGADFLQGRLLVHQRHWAEAVGLFEHARALLGSQQDLATQINLHLGQCYEQLEEPSQMLTAYEAVLASDPQSVPARLGMAAAEWAMQRLDDAAKKYAQLAVERRLPDRCWLDVARLEIQRQPQQDKPDWRLAEQALDNAAKALPEELEVPLLRAEMWVTRNDTRKADRVLEQAREARQKQPEFWAARAEVQLRRGDFARANALLDDATGLLGDRIVLRLARARCVSAELKSKESPVEADRRVARTAIDALAEGGTFNEEERGRLLNGLSHTHLQDGDLAAARGMWRRMAELERYRADLRLRLLLFDLALKMDDEPGMERALQEVRAVERHDGGFGHYGEALRCLWRAEKDPAARDPQLAEARVLLDRVLAQRQNWPAVYIARSRVHELEGNPEQAIVDLREAIRFGESGPEVIRRLVDLLEQRGRHEEAYQELKRQREPLLAADPDLGRLAAVVALGQKDYKWAERVVKPRPGKSGWRELIVLARVQADQKPKEAEKHLREAQKLAPAEPLVWIAWVQFLAFSKRGAEAQQALEEVRAHLPPGKVALALAQCNEILGKQDDAANNYVDALRERRNDPAVVRAAAQFYLSAGRVVDAEPLLRQIQDEQMPGVSAADRDWARHGLAVVLATGMDHRRFQEALRLEGLELDRNGQLVRSRAEESTERLKSQARVLATQPGQRQFRRRAIEILAGLERSRLLLPPDRFILAALYEADGDRGRALEILRDLAASQRHPQYVARCAHAVLLQPPSETTLKEAEKWIGVLEELESERQVEPNTFASVEMRARLLEAQSQGDKALILLRKHVARSAKAQPEEALLLLESLGRQKKFTEAFALCEEMWDGGPSLAGGKRCRPEVAGGASVAVLRSMQPTDEQVRRLEARLKEAIAKNDKLTVLKLHLADLYDLRGRYADAERLYRQILDERCEPHNVVALNNLAWLLAHRDGGADEALTLIEAAVNNAGRRADLLDTRGLVYLKLGRYEQALADFREANEDAPTPTRQYHLARAYFEMKDRATAARKLKEAQDRLLAAPGPGLPGLMHPTEQEDCRRLMAELKVP